METNPQLELAFNFLEYTGTSIFLTGKAGTGKTTFLRELKRRSPKRMIVVAPTGVAAINAGELPFIHFFNCLSDLMFRVEPKKTARVRNGLTINSDGKKSILSGAWICWSSMRSVWSGQICWMR